MYQFELWNFTTILNCIEVTFIRHYKLEEPFDKRKTITEEQYLNLSRGKIDPSINKDIQTYLETNKLGKYDLILYSPTNRTKESSLAIKDYLSENIPLVETPLLRECVWNPLLPGSRIQRFIDGVELTTLAETWERTKQLDKYLKTLEGGKILCVTHSFFMQILYLYYFGNIKSYKDIEYEDIKNSFHDDYLKGFTVSIYKSSN